MRFEELESLKDHDESAFFIANSMNQLTPLVHQIMKELEMVESDNCSPRVLQKLICDFLVSIEPRGFLCCLGVRRTVGSYENCLPPDRRDLEYMFNKLNKILPEKDYYDNPNPPILTVGARALQKHASRNGPVTYWLGKQ